LKEYIRNSSVEYMLFLISGRDGSTGYSFFSDPAGDSGTSIDFNFNRRSGGGEGDPFSGEADKGGEYELNEFVITLRLQPALGSPV
jgi:hypothetical protein